MKINNNFSADDTVNMQSGGDRDADLLQLIHDDNKAVAELFFQFTQVEEGDAKQRIFEQIKTGLTVHAELGEKLLYPLVIETADEEDQEEAEKLVAETEAGNYVASLILEELAVTEPDDEYFEAKMTILCELVKAQVKREEKEMFDKLRATDIDFEDLAEEAVQMKVQFEKDAQKSKMKSQTKSTRKAKGAKAKGSSKSRGSSKSASKTTAKTSSKQSAKAGKKGKQLSSPKSSAKKSSAKLPVSRGKTASKSAVKKKRGR